MKQYFTDVNPLLPNLALFSSLFKTQTSYPLFFCTRCWHRALESRKELDFSSVGDVANENNYPLMS